MSIGHQSRTPTPATPSAPRQEAEPQKSRGRRVAFRLLTYALLVGLPLTLLPMVFPRKAAAKRLPNPASASGSHAHTAHALDGTRTREQRIQDLVDDFRARLSIPDIVLAALVPENRLVVSVERLEDREGSYRLALESSFVDGLTDEELGAVIAHELGHVWIFAHHPYLHTEELANQIALRVVRRETLEQVYEKVWKRAGARGTLQYLPVD